ncbi:MAG: hypothetical protein ACMZ7B_11020 [Balneola sp.]
MSVPCGKCGACKTNRRTQWAFRLKQELKVSKNAYFITLTYNDEEIPETQPDENGVIHQTLDKKHLTDFIKRLREIQYRDTGLRTIRYYAVGEYGTETDRPHYHIILFNINRQYLNRLSTIWGFGHTHIGTVTEASIYYVAKYHVNRNPDENDHRVKEFATMSRKPGIGYNYVETNSQYHNDFTRNYVINNGFKISMPRYYKDKIFTDPVERALQSEIAVHQLHLSENIEARRLEKLGYKNGFLEIHRRALYHSKNYISKSKLNQKF